MTRLRNRALGACLWLAVAGRTALAAPSAGTEPFNFLGLDANARAVGMGGAYTALASDANALLYNPAGLGLARRNELTLMHNQYVAGMTQEYAGLATRWGLGANFNMLRWGRLIRTTYSNRDGTMGGFTMDDLAAGGGYGYTFFDTLSLGFGGKYIREVNDNVRAEAWAFDLGTMLTLPRLPWLRVGASVLNIGPDVTFYRDTEKLPLTWRAGAAAAYKDMTLAADVSKSRFDRVRAAVGGETLIAKVMAVRLGFTMRNDADIGITGGAGWNWKDCSVDYAFAPYGDMGVTHRVSVSLRWGRERESHADEEKPLPMSREEKQRRRFLEGADGTRPGAAPPPPEESPEFHFETARRAIDGRNFKAGRFELEAALSMLGPEDRRRALYYERMGFISAAEGDWGKAKGYYTEGLRLAGSLGLQDRHVADSFRGLGDCLRREGDLEYALKFYRKAFAINPSLDTQRLLEDAEARRKR